MGCVNHGQMVSETGPMYSMQPTRQRPSLYHFITDRYASDTNQVANTKNTHRDPTVATYRHCEITVDSLQASSRSGALNPHCGVLIGLQRQGQLLLAL